MSKNILFVIIKNSNWEISMKNLVTFKRYLVNGEKLRYFWGSLKNPTFREGSRKTNIEGGLLKEGGLDSLQI